MAKLGPESPPSILNYHLVLFINEPKIGNVKKSKKKFLRWEQHKVEPFSFYLLS